MKHELIITVEDGFISSNAQEVEEQVRLEVAKYKDFSVSNETEVPEGKEVLARLRKTRNSIDDWKKNVKNQFMKPYVEFEGSIKRILSLIDEPIAHIDDQVKNYEELWKQDKFEDISEYFNGVVDKVPDFKRYINLRKIFNSRWLNKTFKDSDWQEELEGEVERIVSNIEDIQRQEVFTESEKTQILLDYINHDYDLDKAYNVFNERANLVPETSDETVTITRKRYEELLDIEKKYKNLIGE